MGFCWLHGAREYSNGNLAFDKKERTATYIEVKLCSILGLVYGVMVFGRRYIKKVKQFLLLQGKTIIIWNVLSNFIPKLQTYFKLLTGNLALVGPGILHRTFKMVAVVSSSHLDKHAVTTGFSSLFSERYHHLHRHLSNKLEHFLAISCTHTYQFVPEILSHKRMRLSW